MLLACQAMRILPVRSRTFRKTYRLGSLVVHVYSRQRSGWFTTRTFTKITARSR